MRFSRSDVGLRVGDRADEEVDEPVERVLVHRVDVGEQRDAEVEQRRAVRDGLVAVARLVDLDLGLLGDLLLLADLGREHLGGREDVDRRRVLEDVAALAAREHLEDLVLDLLELLLVRRRLEHAGPFSSSRSGRSLATTMPSSWSSRPAGVIMKLSSVTLTCSSGR